MRLHRAFASVVVSVAALALVGAVPMAAEASGGGGCGRAVSDERGSTVRIHNFCFLPTILRIRPGQTVVFANHDGFAHVVLGANGVWGSFSQLRAHHDVRYRFTRPGVYPYVCTFHPGMVGAVVVGGGAGHGEAVATVTAAGPVVPLGPGATARVASAGVTGTAPATVDAPMSTFGWMPPWELAALAAFVVGVAAFVAIERRRAGHAASAPSAP
jgi:plastocyanin